MKKTLCAICAALLLFSCTERDEYIQFEGFAQGGRYCVKLNMRGVKRSPERIRADVEAILKDIDGTLSGYNKASQLSRFNAGERIVPGGMFLDIYEISYGFYEQSRGAFDVSCGPLFDVWGFGFTGESAPSDEKISQAAARCGMSRLRKDIRSALAPDGSLCASDLLLGPGEPPVLNFNAIAQGYSCDTVASYLRSIGVRDMLVDIGEIYCEGLNPSRGPWSIGIDTPTDGNNTPGADMQGIWRSSGRDGQGVVTSGNYRKYYVWQGKKTAHTIDPRTSRPVTHNLLSATVVAPDATTADAVATWCMVVGAGSSLELIAEMGLEACLICGVDSSMTVTATPGFNITTLN